MYVVHCHFSALDLVHPLRSSFNVSLPVRLFMNTLFYLWHFLVLNGNVANEIWEINKQYQTQRLIRAKNQFEKYDMICEGMPQHLMWKLYITL